jgi:hypothetical protein
MANYLTVSPGWKSPRIIPLPPRSAPRKRSRARFTLLDIEAHIAEASGDWRRAIELRRQTVRIATEWNARGVMIRQQTHLAEALHRAGQRRALETLVAGMLPEVERQGLRGIARELRACWPRRRARQVWAPTHYLALAPFSLSFRVICNR